MHRVVLDTSVLVAGLRSRNGASNAILRAVATGRLRPLVAPALFLEYEAVLKRAEHSSVHGLDFGSVDRFLAAFASAAEPVDLSLRWRPQLSDANDEMVLETAINGQADGLVTLNTKDFIAAAPRFGLRVLNPGQLLKELGS